MEKITIRQKEGSAGLMTGSNTEILLNGKALKGVTAIHFSVAADGIAKTNIEMLAEVLIEGEIDKINPVL